jgi:hypothetical protein
MSLVPHCVELSCTTDRMAMVAIPTEYFARDRISTDPVETPAQRVKIDSLDRLEVRDEWRFPCFASLERVREPFGIEPLC